MLLLQVCKVCAMNKCFKKPCPANCMWISIWHWNNSKVARQPRLIGFGLYNMWHKIKATRVGWNQDVCSVYNFYVYLNMAAPKYTLDTKFRHSKRLAATYNSSVPSGKDSFFNCNLSRELMSNVLPTTSGWWLGMLQMLALFFWILVSSMSFRSLIFRVQTLAYIMILGFIRPPPLFSSQRFHWSSNLDIEIS